MVAEIAEGFLEVGTNDKGEVVLNHPKIEVDDEGCGHIIFGPVQARILAKHLWNKSLEAEGRARQPAVGQIADNCAMTIMAALPKTEEFGLFAYRVAVEVQRALDTQRRSS